MRQKRHLAWGTAGLIVLLVGIMVLSSGAARAGYVQTATPTPGGLVLFQDDFETYSNRWTETHSPKAEVSYLDAALAMRIVSPGVSAWSLPDFATPLDLYNIQVTVDFHAGSLDSWFGFVLGYQDDENFYAVAASRDGTWHYLRRDPEGWTDLTPPQAVSVIVSTEPTTYHLRADVTADQLVFYVDENPIGTLALKGELSGGKLGLFARAGHGYVDLSFDDVVVTNIGSE